MQHDEVMDRFYKFVNSVNLINYYIYAYESLRSLSDDVINSFFLFQATFI